MPRHEQRPVEFGPHARHQMAKRGITEAQVRQIVAHGSIRLDATCDFICQGSVDGRFLQVPCLDMGDHIIVKTAY